MSETAVLVAFAVVISLGVLIWILHVAAHLVVLFTAFVTQLPIIYSIVMFVILPPTFVVFLSGLAFIKFGIGATSAPPDSEPSESEPQNMAASTEDRYSGNTYEKIDKDTKPLKLLTLAKIPDGLAGLDWLAKYSKSEEAAGAILEGPRVVVASFDKFVRGDIVTLKSVGRTTCYLNGIAVNKPIAAKNTRAVDNSWIELTVGSD